MIKSITARNILSHKNTKLEFSEGLNVIVGETKAGKSALVQGLRWLTKNRPTGDSVRSNWGGTSSMSMVTKEGNRIQRIKSDKVNEYRLNGSTFQSFKSDVPEEVAQILNMNDINLNTQFETHFLISQTPGDVAKHYNQIAHLDKIDIGRKNINSWITDIKKNKDSQESNRKKYEEEFKQYEGLDDAEEKIEELEKKEEQTISIVSEIENISNIIYQVEAIDQAIEEESVVIQAEKQVNSILSKIEERDEIESKVTDIEKDINNVEKTDREIEEESQVVKAEDKVNGLIEKINQHHELDNKVAELAGYIEAIENVDKEIEITQHNINAESKVNHIVELIKQRGSVIENINQLGDLIKNIERVDGEKRKEEKKLKELEEEFHAKAPNTCPLCGSVGKLKNV